MITPPSSGEEREYALELQGATRIDTVTLEMEAGDNGPAAGWLRWIGLQHPEWVERHLTQWKNFDRRWLPYIKPPDASLDFVPAYGIFLTEEELKEMRADHLKQIEANGESTYTRRAESLRQLDPESAVTQYAKCGGRGDLHGRSRDEDVPKLYGGVDAAETGLVLEDSELLRVAARYALSLGVCEKWDEGFMCNLPGGVFEHRAFRRSSCAKDVAKILDLAGNIFTPSGRHFLMRRLAEEGAGPMNYTFWRHDYIYDCNQVAYFNTGRMAAYLVMEREWPRVKPYTDLAFHDTEVNLSRAILPDGGCVEGPSYMCPTVRENFYVIKYYARGRGLDLDTLIPHELRSTSDFAALVVSTTDDDVIPICDAGPMFNDRTLDVLVELMPDSHWTTFFNEKRAGAERPRLPSAPPWPNFVHLPEMGPMASRRPLGEHTVKLFIMGNKAEAGHTHEDKGGFVLEFAGQTFAMDPGICDYTDPIHFIYKQCQRHNMLVPVGLEDRPHPENPLLVDIKPVGQGDAVRFHATVDCGAGWERYYKTWRRTWESPMPDRLVIRDEYELVKGDGVEFYWQNVVALRDFR